jgi:hypothetical protein
VEYVAKARQMIAPPTAPNNQLAECRIIHLLKIDRSGYDP